MFLERFFKYFFQICRARLLEGACLIQEGEEFTAHTAETLYFRVVFVNLRAEIILDTVQDALQFTLDFPAFAVLVFIDKTPIRLDIILHTLERFTEVSIECEPTQQAIAALYVDVDIG